VTTAFSPGEEQWLRNLGTLRQAVRQELVARQLAMHLPDGPGLRVADLGCGQGSQLLRLARAGHVVTGLDSSQALLSDLDRSLRAEPPQVRDRVRTILGDVSDATTLLGPASFDVVLCHGVLMYHPDPGPVLETIAGMAVPGAVVSLLVRNGDALAMRPGLAGDWEAAAVAFAGSEYVNRLGVHARADRLQDLTARLAEYYLEARAWYGVRVFTDLAADDAQLPDDATLGRILDCEEQAGRTDPYRGVAALLHLVAQRQAG
jgi:2-polyprenyl-3-methyl-5-hydroxy-6-metoxy-1,4-benzoquinol methylase